MSASDAPVVPERRAQATQAVAGPDRGLSHAQRLNLSRYFREAFDQGARQVGALMILWLRSGPDAALRLGVVASRRSFPRSVDRSRVKRLLRESFRLNRHRFQGAFDVVIVARRALLSASRQGAERDLEKLARRAGLLRE